jgi:hypothetical protein
MEHKKHHKKAKSEALEKAKKHGFNVGKDLETKNRKRGEKDTENYQPEKGEE